MNVHPTKREVKFLNESAIIDHIQVGLAFKIMDFVTKSDGNSTQNDGFCTKSGVLSITQAEIEKLMQGGNSSRTFYTQMLLTGVDAAAVKMSKQEEEAAEQVSKGDCNDDAPWGSQAQAENPAKKMRVDSTQRTGAIEAYISTGRESGGEGGGATPRGSRRAGDRAPR